MGSRKKHRNREINRRDAEGAREKVRQYLDQWFLAVEDFVDGETCEQLRSRIEGEDDGSNNPTCLLNEYSSYSSQRSVAK